MNIRYLIAGVLIYFLSTTSCSSQDNFDYGGIENNAYINTFFNFRMDLPADWVIQSKERVKDITKKGREMVAGEDKNLESAIKAAEVNTANLLVLYEHEVGAAVDYNPSLVLVAENVSHAPGIKTGADYLFHARKLLEQAQIQYNDIDEKFEQVTINGKEFYLMNAHINYMGYDIKQQYYSTLHKGFCFNVIISYVYEDQQSKLEQAVGSMEFQL